MGGLISLMAAAGERGMFQRLVTCSPMLRMKVGYSYHLCQVLLVAGVALLVPEFFFCCCRLLRMLCYVPAGPFLMVLS